MGQLRYTKEQLIDALEARRPWAEQYDAKKLAGHRAEEKAYLAEFRRTCREAAKWDYETIKKNRGEVKLRDNDRDWRWGPPNCPSMTVGELDRQLAIVRALRDKAQVTVSDNGQWSRIFFLLTHDENIVSEAC